MLLFDVGKVCQTKIFAKKYIRYFLASSSNDRELSLDDKTKDYVDRNIGSQVYLLHEVTQLG